jgi:CheY-like chemotaxis protein
MRDEQDSPPTRLLIVDDDPSIRASLSEVLTEIGFSVRLATDGFSALVEIRNEIPAILLSDLSMPGMSGFELLSVVHGRFPSIRAIAMNGAFSGNEVPSGVVADAYYQKGCGVRPLLRIMGGLAQPKRLPYQQTGPALLWIHETGTMPMESLTFRSSARIACGLSNKPLAGFSAQFGKRSTCIAGILFITQSLSRSTGHPDRPLKDVIAPQSRTTSPSGTTKKEHLYVMYDGRAERVAADLGSIGHYPNVETGISRSPPTWRCLLAWMIGYNHDSRIGYMVMVAIMLQVVANALSVRNFDVLVQDGAANPAAPSDDAVIQDHRILDNRFTFDKGIPAEHRAANCPARKNASAGDNGTNGDSRVSLVVEGELCARIGIAGSMYRPMLVIKIERRYKSAQIHLRVEVCLQSPDIAPIDRSRQRLSGNCVPLIVVRED